MDNQQFNLHTHTARCGHADGLDVQYVQSAIQGGFALLGFSDHIPFVGVRLLGDRMLYEQNDEYLASIRQLQREYQDRIAIKVGYEVEFFEDQFDYLMQMKANCDYMILGQHCKYMWYEYDCHNSDENVLEYAQQIEGALAKGFITYIAHPDYFMLGRNVFSKACLEASHRIAKASLTYDVPLEINLNGCHYGKRSYRFYDRPGVCEERYPYPFREFWEIVSTYGCKVLYGYDAHSPNRLLDRTQESKASALLHGLPLHFVQEIQFK